MSGFFKNMSAARTLIVLSRGHEALPGRPVTEAMRPELDDLDFNLPLYKETIQRQGIDQTPSLPYTTATRYRSNYERCEP